MWLYRMHYSPRAPSALLFRLTLTQKYIHLSLHMRFEVTASEPNKCYLSIYSRRYRYRRIAEWYSVWREVAQVKQGLALLVLGWVTACYRCLDSTCSALTQLLQTACEVTNGQISRSELNGTISAGGTRAVMHSIQPRYRSYYTIV